MFFTSFGKMQLEMTNRSSHIESTSNRVPEQQYLLQRTARVITELEQGTGVQSCFMGHREQLIVRVRHGVFC